ncbi:Cystathionine gamma-synthase, partial [Coemansia sp. RSA 2603]
ALVTVIKDKFALPNETAMIFPSLKCADRCVAFIYDQAPKQQSAELGYVLPRSGQVRIVTHVVEPINKKAAALDATNNVLQAPVAIYCVLFPEDLFPLAKQYWQHTGDGISARLADHCLHIARVNEEFEQETIPFSPSSLGGASRRKQGSGYHRTPSSVTSPSSSNVSTPAARSFLTAAGGSAEADNDENLLSEIRIEADTFVEERFGRNLSLKYSANMKAALRRRIAGALSEEEQKQGAQVERGVAGLSADDVFVATTGMGAIFQAHQALLRIGRGKSICFGFSYTDTLKVLQKFGPGAYFLGHGEGADYDELEQILERHAKSAEEDPILAIFTECPSNPLLKTADLSRLRSLADQYGAALVVDETIGSFPNVD